MATMSAVVHCHEQAEDIIEGLRWSHQGGELMGGVRMRKWGGAGG